MALNLGDVNFSYGVISDNRSFRSANDNMLKLKKRMVEVGKETRRTSTQFKRMATAMQGAARKMSRSLGNLRRRVFSLKGAIALLGLGLVAKGFLGVARETENLKVQLKFLTDNAVDAASAFKQMDEFAAKVPFTLREIQSGGAALLTVTDTVKDLTEILTLTADIAAATGLSFEVTAQQIQRSFSAGIGSADLFREKAVGAMLGFEQGVKVSAEATREHIINAFRDGTTSMKGAAAEMASTFDGTMSQISDKWFRFRRAFMDSAPFDFIKSAFIVLNRDLDERFSSIEAAAVAMGNKFVDVFKKMALGTAGIIDAVTPAVRIIANTVRVLVDQFNKLPPWMQTSGIVAGLLLGKKGVAIIGVIGGIQRGLDGISNSFKKLRDQAADALGLEFLKDSLDEAERAADNIKGIVIPLAVEGPGGKSAVQTIQDVFSQIEAVTAERTITVNVQASAATKAGTDIANKLKGQQRISPDFGLALELEGGLTGPSDTVTASQQHLMDQFARGREIIEGIKTETERYNDELKELDKLLSVGAINTKQFGTAQANLRNKIVQTNPVLAELTFQLSNMSDPIVDALFAGENAFEAFKDTALNVIQEVIKEMIKMAILKPILTGIGGAIGGSVGAAFTSVGTAAHGGFISGPTIVGERGPELFLPGRGGTVIPNDKMGGTTINIINDLRGVSGTEEIKKAIAAGINQAAPLLVGASINAVRDERQHNPGFFGGLTT